ncbi:hypothetical protein N0V88_007894 [Collariella sp. IMI 366227]|nr:hypothetical protein N0V88_007894 [Collariella sp. IMI 366227]
MASPANLTPAHSPPGPNAPRPKGILKNSYRGSPPVSPIETHVHHAAPVTPKESKELTIANTQYNAGHRRSSSAAGSRPGGGSRALQHDEDQRAQNPYAKHYDPAEDPSDLEDNADIAEPINPDTIDMDRVDGVPTPPPLPPNPRRTAAAAEDEIPPSPRRAGRLHHGPRGFPAPTSPSRPRAVHVNSSGHDTDGEEYLVGLSAEEREKHRKFEAMRKKHYEMRNVAALLGHPEDEEMEEDGEEEDGEEEDGEEEDGEGCRHCRRRGG